jgi:hypothetical protein
VLWLGEACGELVTDQYRRELPRDRHCPRRSVRLRRPALAFAVDLPSELDLCVVEIAEAHVGSCERKQLRDSGTRECREGEQGPPRRDCRGGGLLQFGALEDPPTLGLRWLGPFGREHQ